MKGLEAANENLVNAITALIRPTWILSSIEKSSRSNSATWSALAASIGASREPSMLRLTRIKTPFDYSKGSCKRL